MSEQEFIFTPEQNKVLEVAREQKSTVRQRILNLMNDASYKPMKAGQIAEAIKAPITQAYVILGKLVKSKHIKRVDGKYFLLTGVNKKDGVAEVHAQDDRVTVKRLEKEMKQLREDFAHQAMVLGMAQAENDRLKECLDHVEDHYKTRLIYKDGVIQYLEAKLFSLQG